MKKLLLITLSIGLLFASSCNETIPTKEPNNDEQSQEVTKDSISSEDEQILDPGSIDGPGEDPVKFTSYNLDFDAKGGATTITSQTKSCFWWFHNVCVVSKNGVEERCFIYNKDYYSPSNNYDTELLGVGIYGSLIDYVPEDHIAQCNKATCDGSCYYEYALLDITIEDFINIKKTSSIDILITVEPNTTNSERKIMLPMQAANNGLMLTITQEAAK